MRPPALPTGSVKSPTLARQRPLLGGADFRRPLPLLPRIEQPIELARQRVLGPQQRLARAGIARAHAVAAVVARYARGVRTEHVGAGEIASKCLERLIAGAKK